MKDIKVFESYEALAGSETGRCGNLFFHRKPDSSKVLVLFNGSVFPNLLPLSPVFHRRLWTGSFRHSSIIVSDPMVNQRTGLTLGWYAGTKTGKRFPDVWGDVRRLMEAADLGSAKVVTFGASGGGFASIMAAINGFSDLAFAVNPQTDIRKYHPTYSQAYLSACWPALGEEDEKNISLLKAIEDAPSAKPFIYAQNTTDKYHLNRHMRPFVKTISEVGANATFIEYTDHTVTTPKKIPGFVEVFGKPFRELLDP